MIDRFLQEAKLRELGYGQPAISRLGRASPFWRRRRDERACVESVSFVPVSNVIDMPSDVNTEVQSVSDLSLLVSASRYRLREAGI